MAASVLLRLLDVDPANVVAIGDGSNDAAMLQLVGTGVAVANASPAALVAASLVAPSNDEDGVAVALRSIFLGDMSARQLMRRTPPCTSGGQS